MEIINSDNIKYIITSDKYFLIIDNKDNRRFVTTNMKKTKLNKKEIDLTFFERKKLNTFWSLDFEGSRSIFTETTRDEFFNDTSKPPFNISDDEDKEYINDKNTNKEIYSTGAQKLTNEEINEMKEKGLKGDELIKTIMESNTSMDKRTLFSQEKMIKKKEKKHKHLIWVTDTNLFNIVETFFIEDIKAINFLRVDSISTMLVNSNFKKNSKTLIYEETHNVLTSAYAMRTSHEGNVCSIFVKRIQNKNLNLFNLNHRDKCAIGYVNMDVLLGGDGTSFNSNLMRKTYLYSFDNLVLCLKDDTNLIKCTFELLPFLKSSGSLVVFAKEVEIICQLEKMLIEQKLALDVRIHETFTREYQVLPRRTHPNMNTKGFSCYVLTGIKLDVMP